MGKRHEHEQTLHQRTNTGGKQVQKTKFTSLAFRTMQINALIRYHYTFLEVYIYTYICTHYILHIYIHKYTNMTILNAGENMKKLYLSYSAVRNIKQNNNYGIQYD